MLAQWISSAYREGLRNPRREPLIALASAPLHASEFRGVILGQLGEHRTRRLVVEAWERRNS